MSSLIHDSKQNNVCILLVYKLRDFYFEPTTKIEIIFLLNYFFLQAYVFPFLNKSERTFDNKYKYSSKNLPISKSKIEKLLGYLTTIILFLYLRFLMWIDRYIFWDESRI